MTGIDRPATSEVVQHGHGEFAANSLLPPGDRMYEAVKDGFSRYAYDPTRARSMLGEAGFNPTADGAMVGPDGQRLSVKLWTTEGGDREIAIIADYLQQVGATVAEQMVIPGAASATASIGPATRCSRPPLLGMATRS